MMPTYGKVERNVLLHINRFAVGFPVAIGHDPAAENPCDAAGVTVRDDGVVPLATCGASR
ncbi:hypothetical protein [Sphingomonas sp. Leaf21]|uniref:hypothetical protein n=1 Tax=Sphingomonas sp. Leaf21 TaxID=2876550 RepID=UPI001E463FEE|nr:hypothetical protein [Sphingomonas sp. Leaf21]